jgi:hypothetical protein
MEPSIGVTGWLVLLLARMSVVAHRGFSRNLIRRRSAGGACVRQALWPIVTALRLP